MNELEVLKNQLSGLESKLESLRSDERAFLTAKGIDDALVKAANENQKLDADIQGIKEEIGELQYKKSMAVAGTSKAMAERMAGILTQGKAFFDIDAGKVLMGWVLDGRRVPYNGLSGGQKVQFDAALSKVFAPEGSDQVVIIEAAEVDYESFHEMIEKITEDKSETQWMVNHWADPFPADSFPNGYKGWNIVRFPLPPVPGEQQKIFDE